MTLKEQILAAEDLAREEVTVPEWGGATFYIRTMSGADREVYEAGIYKPDGSGELDRGRIRAHLIACCAVDAAGERIFAPEDVPELAKKSAKVLIRLADVAHRLNGLTAEAAETAAKK